MRHAARSEPNRTARAAGDPSATIVSFKFSPSTLTVHTGDTVTWTNEDSVQHSATATNGSFNTGLLNKGQSGSHTFNQAGTFAYICSIHPFMHGTIVVTGSTASASSSGSGSSSSGSGSGSSGSGSGSSGSGSGSSGSGTGSSGSSGTTTGSSSAQTLPFTGLDLAGTALSGLALLGLGVALRRRIRGGAGGSGTHA